MRTIIAPDDARVVRVQTIRERRAEGATLRQLAAEYEVSASYLCRVLQGTRAAGPDRRHGKWSRA